MKQREYLNQLKKGVFSNLSDEALDKMATETKRSLERKPGPPHEEEQEVLSEE